MKRYLLFLFILQSVYSQNDFDTDILPYEYSFYISAGAGLPQGFRFETGYTLEIISIGLSFGINDNWSQDPGEGTFGILGRLIMNSSYFDPYILFGAGTTLSIFGESDSYYLLSAGAMVQLNRFLYLRPELGLVFTSRHKYGGSSLFGSRSPAVFENRTRAGFNISFEVVF